MLLWVLAGCADKPGGDTGPTAPLIAAADMKTVDLAVKGMT
jgi:hypothetical protein